MTSTFKEILVTCTDPSEISQVEDGASMQVSKKNSTKNLNEMLLKMECGQVWDCRTTRNWRWKGNLHPPRGSSPSLSTRCSQKSQGLVGKKRQSFLHGPGMNKGRAPYHSFCFQDHTLLWENYNTIPLLQFSVDRSEKHSVCPEFREYVWRW